MPHQPGVLRHAAAAGLGAASLRGGHSPLWRRALADLQPDSKGRYDGPTVLSRLEDAIRATTKATLPETQEAFLDVISMPFEPEVAGPAEPGCACPACLEAQVALDGPADAPRAQRLREALIYGLAFHLEHVLKATTALDRRMGAPHIAWRRGKTSYQGGDDDRAA